MDSILRGFEWLVSEYRRTFLALTVLHLLAPFAAIIVLFMFLAGKFNSPMLTSLQSFRSEHITQTDRLVKAVDWLEINNQAITTGNETAQRNDERMIRRMDVQCLNDAAKTATTEDDRRCETLSLRD